MSLNANRPVNGSPEASSFCVTRYPSSGEDDSPSSCATNRLLIWMPSSAADPHTESQRTAVSELNSCPLIDRKSTRLNSSHLVISYAVFCLKKKNKNYEVYTCAIT